MRNLACAGLVLVVLCGCAPGSDQSSPSVRASVPPTPITSLAGPGGSVSIGDTVEDAKKAFPAPKGASTYEKSLSFAILAKQGWAWAEDSGDAAFEVAMDGGKVIAIAQTVGSSDGDPALVLKGIGEPTRKAVGKSADVYVWEAGDNARFWVHMKSGASILPSGTITLIGNKEQLKLLSYRYDDPETFIKQLDASSEMANSPEMKKAFEDAKRRAKERVKQPN